MPMEDITSHQVSTLYVIYVELKLAGAQSLQKQPLVELTRPQIKLPQDLTI